MKSYFGIILSSLLLSCGSADSQGFQRMNAEQFSQLIEDEDVQVVDVRTPGEINQGKIKGALEIDWFDPEFIIQMEQLDKSKAVALYCRSGNRSQQAARKIEQLGFVKIYELKGGFNGWKAEGLPTNLD